MMQLAFILLLCTGGASGIALQFGQGRQSNAPIDETTEVSDSSKPVAWQTLGRNPNRWHRGVPIFTQEGYMEEDVLTWIIVAKDDSTAADLDCFEQKKPATAEFIGKASA